MTEPVTASPTTGRLLAPTYRLSVDGRDITPTVNARLVSLRLEETRGEDADRLDLTLSDHDGKLAIPRQGATIAVAIGWEGQPLVDKGTFKVDEVEHSGAPDQVTIRARSADLANTLRQRRDQSWHQLTLEQILRTIATRNGLTPRIHAALASVALAHIDQTNESDLNFLTRLGKRYDAVATAKKGHLLFLPINGTTNSKGQS
jgi:phage protein D